MSTLPFLLSVADELDNINSQSYMDDFGLGFHPHRQYYRTPTIQLSLPAGTDWMQEERQRCRTHKFYDDTQNNLQASPDEAEEDEAGNAADMDKYRGSSSGGCGGGGSAVGGNDGGGGGGNCAGPSTSSAAANRQKYTSALNSNGEAAGTDGDNIDNSVQMYKLSKKCCKNYYRPGHAADSHAKQKNAAESGSGGGGSGSGGGGGGATGSYKLHTKCMEANNSSSEESLQKVSSSIEFLTCFLVKKTRASKHSTSSSGAGAGAAASGGGKKS